MQKDNRTSVSSEAFGKFHKKEDFKPPVYPKDPQVKERLKQRLEQAFMFSALNPAELGTVLDALQNFNFKAGDTVIKQGDDGDNLFVVDSG